MQTLLTLGPFEIRYYGIFLALAFLAAYCILKSLAKQNNIKPKLIEDYLVYMMIGIIVGARLFHVLFYNWAYFSTNPLEIFYIWRGGIASHGGIIGGIIANYLFTKKHNLSFYKLSDLAVIPIALGAAFVRLGNFTNGELFGKITTLPWATEVNDTLRHPVQIYQAIANVIIFITLTITHKTKQLKDGTLTWAFFLLYGIARFCTEFFKDLPPYYVGLNIAQYASLLLVIIAIFALKREMFKYKKSTK